MEEAYFALKANLPTYLIGAFGGCTRAIIDALAGPKPESITLKGQVSLDEDYRNQHPSKVKTPYGQRVADFKTRAARHGLELIDSDALLSVFEAAGANNLGSCKFQ